MNMTTCPPSLAPSRPVLLVNSGGLKALPQWQQYFAEFAPEYEVRHWSDTDVDPERVAYALVWQPTAGQLVTYPKLRAILSSAAGVDHILADPALPRHVPIVRMVTAETQQRMAEFAGMAALMMAKSMPAIIDQQRRAHWEELASQKDLSDTVVGVMGLGALGAATASYLHRLGFAVRGWSQSLKQIDGVRCFAGHELQAFLQETDILVGLLPDTPQTRHLIRRETLAWLPEGAAMINLGRASLINTPDLIEALDSGHLQAALLDVFDQEPLPQSDPLWHHPKIVVTPHSAAYPSLRGKARQAALAIAAIDAGQQPEHLYLPERGY